MLYVDSHAHLDLFSEDELDRIIENAKKTGVKAVVANGTDEKSNRKVLEFSRKYPLVKASLGLYPVDALRLSDGNIDAELGFIKKHASKIVAIGEVGLDYLKAEDKGRQKDVLSRIIAVAKAVDKPLIVHSRKAEADAVELLFESGVKKAVMHCFMADMKTVKKAEDSGFYFSIPCIIAASSHFQQLVEKISLSRVLTETDAPFLSPVQGRKSEPSMVAESVRIIAGIKGISEEDCANIIYSNYQRMFR